MKKTKTQKGITLVALIITIIILLILAVVTISAVSGDGIIQHAKNASNSYNSAKEDENGVLLGYESYLNNNVPKAGLNFWQEKGLTSSKVSFGATYTSTVYNKEGVETATIKMTPNICTLYEDENEVCAYGQGYFDQFDYYVSIGALQENSKNELLWIGTDSIGFVNLSGPEAYLFHFYDNGKCRLYIKPNTAKVTSWTSEIINNEYLVGDFAIN